MSKDQTPLRQQYLDIKRNYPDTIVFFRLGDFYETFDEDARITSRELDIVLTSRPVSKGVRVPLAGIPHHAVDNYLARLIEKGYHVAICEQVGVQPEKGIFPREVVRVVTPGTVVEPGMLSSERNNYLAAAFIQDKIAGIAYTDLSTGEFATTQLDGKDVIDQVRGELVRLQPSEILWPDSQVCPQNLPGQVTNYESWHFDKGRCQDILKEQFNVTTLDGYGLQHSPLSIRTAGAILQYLQQTAKDAVKLLTSIKTYQISEFMVLDSETRRNLELTETLRSGKTEGSLLGVLDHTSTPMGKRLLRNWVSKPLVDVDSINERLDLVEYLYNNGILRASLNDCLKEFSDLERLINRVVSGHAMPKELVALRNNLSYIPDLLSLIPDENPGLHRLMQNCKPCSQQLDVLESAIMDDPPAALANIGIIRPSYSSELESVLASSQHARDWINNLETTERARTGIKTLKVGYNKVFGYYIEVTKANSVNVPDDYIRKQTLVNGERYITPELKEYEILVLNSDSQVHEIELRIYKSVCEIISNAAPLILATAQSLGELDTSISLATAAAMNGYVRPLIVNEKCIEIKDGRHPVVERLTTGERFVANDTYFAEGEIVRIITGPNMSGKSTFLRQVALITLMAQMGSFVPATEAKIGLVDRIFTRIGAQDEIHTGQSTFMVEMIEAANILHHATQRSLLILDEIGRGTSTYDGLSIAWAIIEYIHSHPDLKSITLFATHYHELIQLEDLLPGISNYNVAVTESDGKVIFLHKIVPGGADKSYGIHVAQIAGLPTPVIQRASEIIRQLESSSGHTLPESSESTLQLTLFPENNPFIEAFKDLDINTLTPIQALNLLYEWRQRFFPNKNE
ncbi:MAG: DNA mismatch repair protein MutS [Anaerolineaceae bacterium]|nr:DNA mismatch repair protein MutS [Anaerolineaceae bacterium]